VVIYNGESTLGDGQNAERIANFPGPSWRKYMCIHYYFYC